MRKKIIKKAFLYSPALLLIVFAVSVFSNPLRWPAEQIRAYMLKRTPVGTNMDDVIKLIEKNKNWEIDYINSNGGYKLRMGRPGEPSPDDIAAGNVIITVLGYQG